MNTKLKILVVDDNPRISGLLKTILQATGRYAVIEENDSSNAFARTKSFEPDLVILDVDMPGKDGGEVAHEIHSDARFFDLPILFCTSLVSADEETAGAGTRNGVSFLSKPINPTKLINVVANILERATEGVS